MGSVPPWVNWPPRLGQAISPATVSTVAKQLDAVVAAFHARPLRERYRVLMLDGVVLARKTGAGAIRRPVLVALGLREDGKKEVIEFRLAHSESAAEWERFLGDLIRRGLDGDGLEMVRRPDQPAVKADLQAVMNAKALPRASSCPPLRRSLASHHRPASPARPRRHGARLHRAGGKSDQRRTVTCRMARPLARPRGHRTL
ncbi:MAG TPA: transposase [Stellaceae bacterium]|nr:transposase [Stellaceae bacterium]